MIDSFLGSDDERLPDDSADEGGGLKCGKKICLIFGGLLLLAVFYVPYRVKVVSYEANSKTRLIMRTAFYAKGFMSLPGYLAVKGREPQDKAAAGRYYDLDATILFAEFGLILFLGAADYLLFCRLLGRTASRRQKIEQ